jgi:hypothetical protein
MIFTDVHLCIFNSTDYQVSITNDNKFVVLQLAPDKSNCNASCTISIAENVLDDFVKKILEMLSELDRKSAKAEVMQCERPGR